MPSMMAAGRIVIGKRDAPEFGLGSHTFNEVFDVTRLAPYLADSSEPRLIEPDAL